MRDLQAVLSVLYQWLIHDLANDICGDAMPIQAYLQEAIEYVSILVPGPPLVDIAFGVSIANATYTAAERKLTRPKYETSAPVELLLHIHDQPLVLNKAALSEVCSRIIPLVDTSNATGHIRRVWFFRI